MQHELYWFIAAKNPTDFQDQTLTASLWARAVVNNYLSKFWRREKYSITRLTMSKTASSGFQPQTPVLLPLVLLNIILLLGFLEFCFCSTQNYSFQGFSVSVPLQMPGTQLTCIPRAHKHLESPTTLVTWTILFREEDQDTFTYTIITKSLEHLYDRWEIHIHYPIQC